VNGVLAVRSVEQNHQSYPAVSAAIFGQQLLCWGVRQEDIDAIATDRLREGRRLVENPHDDDRRLVAWQLFEVTAQDWISGENRDGHHEGRPSPIAAHDYATDRSPMTTRSVVGASPRINARSTVFPTLSGPSSRMISRTRARGRSVRIDAHDENAATELVERTARRDCAMM
jgi:hypothetical protein